jgi:hypothetical protein
MCVCSKLTESDDVSFYR